MKKPNFTRVIKSVLKKHGLSEKELGERIGLSQTQVNKLKSGFAKEPKYTVGVKLMELYEQ